MVPVKNCPVSLKKLYFWYFFEQNFEKTVFRKIMIKIIVSSTLIILHSVEKINVYVEINHFKVSRFHDNDTGQQIRKLV